MDIVILMAGIGALWIGTELTIRGAVSIAGRFGLSEFIVGTAILSVGSDLPELSIAIGASIQSFSTGDNAAKIVIGSALGSAMGQIGFVLGTVGLTLYLSLPRKTALRHGGVMIGAVCVLGVTLVDGVVSRSEGAILLLIYLTYVLVLFSEVSKPDKSNIGSPVSGGIGAWFSLALGLGVVILGAEWTVQAAMSVAERFGIDEGFVAICVVGLGTSLPELSISLAAAAKRRSGLSIGNLIGSNIFDTLVPVGAAAAIAPLAFTAGSMLFDLLYLLILSVLVLVFLIRKRGLQRTEAAILLAAYFAYLLIRLAGSGMQRAGSG